MPDVGRAPSASSSRPLSPMATPIAPSGDVNRPYQSPPRPPMGTGSSDRDGFLGSGARRRGACEEPTSPYCAFRGRRPIGRRPRNVSSYRAIVARAWSALLPALPAGISRSTARSSNRAMSEPPARKRYRSALVLDGAVLKAMWKFE